MNRAFFGFDVTNPKSRAISVDIFISGIEGMVEEYESGKKFNSNKHALLSNLDDAYDNHYWSELRKMLEELDPPLLNYLEEKFIELRSSVN